MANNMIENTPGRWRGIEQGKCELSRLNQIQQTRFRHSRKPSTQLPFGVNHPRHPK